MKTKLPPRLIGTEFLRSSHFRIGKEPQLLTKEQNRSTFQIDFPSKAIPKQDKVKVPEPASIMHKEAASPAQCSVTREQFVRKEFVGSNYSRKSLTKTNFKMDSDKCIDSFKTTHGIYYTAQPPVTIPGDVKTKPMGSHIPQGDKEKVCWPVSNYKKCFQEKTLPVVKTDDVVNPTFFSNNILQGDERSLGSNKIFSTTSRNMFSEQVPHQRTLLVERLKYPKTEIPCGDREPLQTTQRLSFMKYSSAAGTKIDGRETNHANLQRTTFKIGDGRLDCHYTTTKNSFKAHDPGPAVLVKVLNVRQDNILSPGDWRQYNEARENNVTVHRSDYVAPPPWYRTTTVNGLELRAKSKVCFGNDTRSFYETTTEANFPYKKCSRRENMNVGLESSVPLNFYDNFVPNSSYRRDYKPVISKLLLDPVAYDNLKKSHIFESSKNLRELSTTHACAYTRKEYVCVSSQRSRQQRSFVPIGTIYD